jgi:hypothetical protein
MPKKGNNMTTQFQPGEPVKVTPETEAVLAQVAKQLEERGEVLVQTDEDVGTETQPVKPTVH